MTHFLRYFEHTVVDIESTVQDIRCVIAIDIYSLLLLKTDKKDQINLIVDMNSLQELRREWFESVNKKPETKVFVKKRLLEVGKRWNLQYVED